MITDTEARKIASEWHGGGGTALYAFASTGAIDTARVDHNLEFEIIGLTRSIHRKQPNDARTLHSLWEYVSYHGKRGPVDGWGKLTW